MYLSRLILNPRSRAVQRDLASPHDMHRTVMRGFPENLDEHEVRILYRLDQIERGNQLCLLVQSQLEPDWTQLDSTYLVPVDMDNPALKQFDLRPVNGQRFTFRLRANPTKRLGQSAGNDKGKRVGLYAVDEQIQWLNRKAEGGGFAVESVLPTQQHRSDDRKHDLKFFSVQFDGILWVTDAAQFALVLANGIGSGKAFGFGLLSVARAG
jgi:CRISPR system Cascade subunit CasE